MRCEAIGRDEVPGPELDEYLPTQRTIGRFERNGSAALPLFVLAGFVGPFRGNLHGDA